MERNFDFDFSNKTIEYCFVRENFKQNEYRLDDIIDKATTSIIIYDTNEIILKPFLKLAQDDLNSDDILIIGLVSDNSLLKLKEMGVVNGFFRSTNEKSNAAIIIIDKKEYYVAFNDTCIFRIKETNFLSEIFEYINHIMWTKTLTEYCQGNLNTIKETRLSVVEPQFKGLADNVNHKYGTKKIESKMKLVFKEDDLNAEAYVLYDSIPDAYGDDFDTLYVNLFKDYYFPIENWETLIKSKSHSNVSYDELVGETIWINGKSITINKEDSISKTIYKPLDEYKEYIPNYEKIAEEYKGYCKTLHMHIDVKPITIDSSYKIYDSYRKIDSFQNEINSLLKKIENMSPDKKILKQIEAIKNSRMLSDMISKYNNFIDEIELGDKTLLNKNTKLKKIIFNEKDLIVPSEIIGKLYTKENVLYLALNDESKVEQAKDWLKENKMEAVLILGKEN